MRLVCGCGILCLLIVLPVAHSSVGLTHPGARPVNNSVGETDQSTPTVPGCTWEQMSECPSLAIPVCFKISDSSIVQPVEIKGYDAKTGDAIDMKDKNVKAEYKKAKIIRRYKFLVPVNTELVCACPGSKYVEEQQLTMKDKPLISTKRIIHFEGNTNSFEAKCTSNENMEVYDPILENNNLGAYKCGRNIEYGPKEIEDPRKDNFCPEPYTWEGIGFDVKLEGTVQRYNLLEICYDEQKERAIYVKHKWISGTSVPGLRPPSNSWKGAQGIEKGKYDGDWHKGHLAPDADFPIYELKFLTYFYENAAPQYGPFNTGQWGQLESKIRDEFSEATIFTGTSNLIFDEKEVLEIEQEMEDLNLPKTEPTEENKGRPNVFWKIVIGTDAKDQNRKVKGYLYSNKIEPRSDFYLKKRFCYRFLCSYKESVSAGYCFHGADVQQITQLLKEADVIWGNPDFTDAMNEILKGIRTGSSRQHPSQGLISVGPQQPRGSKRRQIGERRVMK